MTLTLNSDVLARADDVALWIRTQAAAFGGASALPSEVVAKLQEAGLYRLCLPSELGGLVVPIRTAVTAVESLSRADGSVGWCVAVANNSASLLAALDPAEAAEIADEPERLCIAGGFAATGRAAPCADAFEVSGRWSFASGCTAADWLLGGALVTDSAGRPGGEPLVVFFPACVATIVENWDVAGLQATGSHDVVADRVLVPTGRSCTLSAPRWSHDSMARVPFFTLGALLTAATVLGMAERALEELVKLANTKVHFGRQAVLSEEEVFQQELAAVAARLRAGRAYLYAQAAETERAADDGTVPTIVQAEAFLAARAVRDAALQAATFAHEEGGTTSIRQDSPLNRCLQDILVATRHVGLTRTPAGAIGRVLLGQGPQPPVLT